jgi:hypothetical protein
MLAQLVLVALSWSAPANAGVPDVPAEITDPSARQHFAAGMQAWLEEDYPRAQRELEAAHALDPVPVLLYSLGQLSRLQGDCVRARERFLAFLDTNPPEAAVTDTRVNLERCKVAEPEAEPEPIAEPVAPQPVAPRRIDALGVALTVSGGVIASVGLGVFGGAFAVRGRANDETSYPAFLRGTRRADAMYWSGVALTTVGTAVLVGGIVRLVMVRKRRVRRSTTARRRSAPTAP